MPINMRTTHTPMQEKRAGIVRGVTSGVVKLVVCSDAMARGMDLPQVEVVVNYDSPTSIKVSESTYVFPACALREGMCLSCVWLERRNVSFLRVARKKEYVFTACASKEGICLPACGSKEGICLYCVRLERRIGISAQCVIVTGAFFFQTHTHT